MSTLKEGLPVKRLGAVLGIQWRRAGQNLLTTALRLFNQCFKINAPYRYGDYKYTAFSV